MSNFNAVENLEERTNGLSKVRVVLTMARKKNIGAQGFYENGTEDGSRSEFRKIRRQHYKHIKGCLDLVSSIWKAFGGNTRDLSSFGEETDKTKNLHQHLLRISTQQLETASHITHDAVTTHLKTASQDFQTASDCTTHPII
ncbi:hypothetical protein Tco_0760434 [Tanacetum coccineum]